MPVSLENDVTADMPVSLENDISAGVKLAVAV